MRVFQQSDRRTHYSKWRAGELKNPLFRHCRKSSPLCARSLRSLKGVRRWANRDDPHTPIFGVVENQAPFARSLCSLKGVRRGRILLVILSVVEESPYIIVIGDASAPSLRSWLNMTIKEMIPIIRHSSTTVGMTKEISHNLHLS